ncbi:TPA: hypothetical protein EYP44_02950 [Candidatus Bathyarchaeota archaeon]|nr:hypothetical protein [Candidatus Bathyarchaeota archaeon]
MSRILVGFTGATEMSRPLDLSRLEEEFRLLRRIGDEVGYEGGLVDELHFALCALGDQLIPSLKRMGYVLYPRRSAMPEVGELARRHEVRLGGHGSYLINLASSRKALRRASKGHITALCNRMEMSGGMYGVVHVGYWKGVSRKEAEEHIVESLEGFADKLPVPIALENAGLFKAIGPVDFLLGIAERFRNVTLCIDFAHIHATTKGGIKSKEAAEAVLAHVKERLGDRLIVIHVSDIRWGESGEVRHVRFGESDLNYRAVFEAIAEEAPKNCVVICESPDRANDTRLLIGSLRARFESRKTEGPCDRSC